jgi:hypothetical protein
LETASVYVLCSRNSEKATYEWIPFCFLAGGWHPAHDTIASFGNTFLPEIAKLFVQVLAIAHELGVLKSCNISRPLTAIAGPGMAPT